MVIHDMPMEEAKKYINELRAFYGNGWKEYYRNRKEGAKEMQKTEAFCVTKADGFTVLFVNAEHGQRYGQILH